MVIECVRAIDVAAQVAVRTRPPQLLVPLGSPLVQRVLRTCLGRFDLRSVGAFAHRHGAPARDGADRSLQGHLRATLADGDDHFAGSRCDPVATGLHRSHRRERRFDVDVRDAVGQLAVNDRALDHPQPEVLAGKLQQLDLGVVPEPDEVPVVELDFGTRTDP